MLIDLPLCLSEEIIFYWLNFCSSSYVTQAFPTSGLCSSTTLRYYTLDILFRFDLVTIKSSLFTKQVSSVVVAKADEVAPAASCSTIYRTEKKRGNLLSVSNVHFLCRHDSSRVKEVTITNGT